MPDPAVVVAMRQFKAGLLAQEAAQMQEMAARWVIIERRLEADILALAEEVAAMRQAGQAVNVGKLYRLDRYKKLLVQTNNEMLGYVKYLDGRIAEAQARMAQLGISNASQAIRYAAWPQVIQTFDVLPISAVEYMVGNAANGAPLGELLKLRMIRDAEGNVLPGVWDRLTTTLVNGTGLGWNPRKTARVMRADLAQGLDKALVISRTETLRVYRESSRAQYQESGVVEGQRRLAAHDDRTCAACLMADGEILGLNETMYDHVQGRCVVPGSLVSGSRVEAFISSHYSGDVITISTTSGNLMTVTSEHPVLTERGWVAAHLIHEGDNVVSYGGNEWTTAAERPDEYQVPTLIEDIPRALNMDVLASVPATTEDFNSDGAYSKVYVVSANRLLRDDFDASLLKPGLQELFSGRGVGALLLSGLGNVASVLECLAASPGRFLGDCYTAMVFLNRCLLGQELVGLCYASEGNASDFQPPAYGRPGNIEVLGEVIHRLAAHVSGDKIISGNRQPGQNRARHLLGGDSAVLFERSEQPASLEFIREALGANMPSGDTGFNAITSNVIFDPVLEIGSRTFRGHVYNLQTQDRWYSVNGIITHNCTTVPIVQGVPPPEWESGEDWFKGQSSDTQRKILGKGRHSAWLAGGFNLRDVVHVTEDETWGKGLAVKPLKDLVQ